MLRALLKRHALFGGRDAELALVDRFLATPGAPYLCLLGPAGLGKTALLANWIGRRRPAGGEAVYHFISRPDGVADEDAVLRSLCEQLIAFHGLDEVLPPGAGPLREIYPELLSRPVAPDRQLLVVLDAVDEANGWAVSPSLFPTPLPERTRVVFSAGEMAGANWLDMLDLQPRDVEVIRLERMRTPEIGALLQSAGVPAADWAADTGFLDVLWKTSEGDPYYLRYLVEDIQAGRVRSTADLAARPAGLNRYFDSWWAEVGGATGDGAVQDLVGYLLVGLGPLQRDELVEISDSDALSGMSFERALEKIRRHVVGNEEAGFALGHRRFRDYLAAARIKAQERRPYLERLLDYCERGRERPSRYALHYYGLHLVEAGRASELCGLVRTFGWYAGHLALDPTAGSFLRDVEAGATAISALNAQAAQRGQRCPRLADELQLALIVASLRSSSHRIGSKLLSALLEAELWTPSQALMVARQMPDDEGKARIIETLAPFSAAVLEQTLALVHRIGDAASQARALLSLHDAAPGGQGALLLQEAWELVRTIDHASTRVTCLTAVASRLEEPQRRTAFAQALQATESLPDPEEQAEALLAVLGVAAPSDVGDIVDRTMAAALAIEPAQTRAAFMHRLAGAAPAGRTRELAHAAATAARGIGDPSERAIRLTSLLRLVARSERERLEGEIRSAVGEIGDDRRADALVAWLAADPAAPEARGLLEEALSSARGIPDALRRFQLFGRLAAAASEASAERGRAIVQDASVAAGKSPEGEWRVSLLLALAAGLQGELRRHVLEEALDAAREIADPGPRIVALCALGPELQGRSRRAALADAFTVPGALFLVTGKLHDVEELARLACVLANDLSREPRAALLTLARAWTRGVGATEGRAAALTTLVPKLAPDDRDALAEEALASGLAMAAPLGRAEAMAALAPWLDGPRRQVAIDAGVAAARRIDETVQYMATYAVGADGDYVEETVHFRLVARAVPLFRLAAAAPEPERGDRLREACESLYELDQFRQADVLRAVAPVLPASTVAGLLDDIAATASAPWRREILAALLARWADITSPDEARARAESLARAIPTRPASAALPETQPRDALPSAPDGGANALRVQATLNAFYVAGAFRLTRHGREEGLVMQLEEGRPWPDDAARESVESMVRADAIEEQLAEMSAEQVDQVLRSAEGWQGDHWREAKVALVSRLLQLGSIDEALSAAARHWRDELPPELAAELIPHVEPDQRGPMLARALAAARAREEAAPRATALAALADRVDAAQGSALADEALAAARLAIADDSWKGSGLASRVGRLSSASRPALHATWIDVLARNSKTRRELLDRLAAFWPIATTLGEGEGAVSRDAARVLGDIVRWWP